MLDCLNGRCSPDGTPMLVIKPELNEGDYSEEAFFKYLKSDQVQTALQYSNEMRQIGHPIYTELIIPEPLKNKAALNQILPFQFDNIIYGNRQIQIGDTNSSTFPITNRLMIINPTEGAKFYNGTSQSGEFNYDFKLQFIYAPINDTELNPEDKFPIYDRLSKTVKYLDFADSSDTFLKNFTNSSTNQNSTISIQHRDDMNPTFFDAEGEIESSNFPNFSHHYSIQNTEISGSTYQTTDKLASKKSKKLTLPSKSNPNQNSEDISRIYPPISLDPQSIEEYFESNKSLLQQSRSISLDWHLFSKIDKKTLLEIVPKNLELRFTITESEYTLEKFSPIHEELNNLDALFKESGRKGKVQISFFDDNKSEKMLFEKNSPYIIRNYQDFKTVTRNLGKR